MVFGILGWLIVGFVIGFVASKLVNLRGDDPWIGIAASALAAAVAGGLYSVISGAGVTAWNLWSILWAAVGAVVGAALFHAIRSRFISHERYVPRRSY